MKITSTIAISFLAASLLSAAETNTNDQIKAAVAKLKEQPNYSWTMKLELPGMPFTPEPQSGKVAKDGVALVTQDFNGETVKAAFKEGKVVVFVEDQWQTVSHPDSTDFGDRPAMTARWLAGAGTAAQEAENLIGKVKVLKAGEEGLWSGDLTEKGATDLLAFGPRSGVKHATGSGKFWLKDGALLKFQSHATGKVAFGPDQEERDVDLTRTVEIQDVGKTKVEIPEEAKKKLEGK